MNKARAFTLAEDKMEYWSGFQRGLRRLYENFGTEEEHQAWLNRKDEYRRDLHLGYWVGFKYDELPEMSGPAIEPEKIKELRKVLGLTPDALGLFAFVSGRTIEGWEQGRQMSWMSLLLIKRYFG